eukprot:g114.t1
MRRRMTMPFISRLAVSLLCTVICAHLIVASVDTVSFQKGHKVVITAEDQKGAYGIISGDADVSSDLLAVDVTDLAGEKQTINIDKKNVRHLAESHGETTAHILKSAEGKGKIGLEVGVTISDTDPPEHVVGTVTAVLGDELTVKLPNGNSVVRYDRNVWLLEDEDAQIETPETSSANATEAEERVEYLEVECRGKEKAKVTQEQQEYLTKTFPDDSYRTMSCEQLEALLDIHEREKDIDVSDSIPENVREGMTALGDIAEDNYMAPYFKDTGGGLTYFDLDRLGVTPSDLIRMREQQKMAKARQGDFAGAAAVGDISAADLILAEKQKEIQIRIEEKKMEKKLTCKFACKRKTSIFERTFTRASSSDSCFPEGVHEKWKSFLKKKNRDVGIRELKQNGWAQQIDPEPSIDRRNRLRRFLSKPKPQEPRYKKVLDGDDEETILSYEEAVATQLETLAISVEVECDPPNPKNVPMGAQWVESACETQACSTLAIEACQEEEISCDGDASGSPDSLLLPLRSCPYRCQDGTHSPQVDCRVKVSEASGEIVPVYANVSCASCLSKGCLAKVPDECTKSIFELGADTHACDVSKSGKIEYLTSWSQIEKQKALAIEPDTYKKCLFECKSKGMFGMTKTCYADEASKQPVYESVMCARCGTAECTQQVQEKCQATKTCDAELGAKYGKYLVESDTEMTCNYKCIQKDGIFSRKDCVAEVGDAEESASTETVENGDAEESGDITETNDANPLTVNVTCFDCESSKCRDMVAPACKESAESCQALAAKKSHLIFQIPIMAPVADESANEEETHSEATKHAEEDTTSDVKTGDFESGGAFATPMSVEESDEQRAAKSAQRELEGRIAFDRWMHFAKVKSGCDTFPYCNHIPSPPPLLPAPLDLESPRANVKYPFVPPLRANAPFRVKYDTSKMPMTPMSVTPRGESTRKLGMEDGSKPLSIPGMTSPKQGVNDVGHMYDVGYKPTEFEEKPFQKAGIGGWAYQFNLYRPALGRLEESPAPDRRGEGADTAYPDWLDKTKAEENWGLLSKSSEASFDVFDRLTQQPVKGRFPTDPEVSVAENAVGDIPSAPLSQRQRQESFIGGAEEVLGQPRKLITWDRNMYDSKSIQPSSGALRYLKKEGIAPNCAELEDAEEKAGCFMREKEAEASGR